MLRVRLKPKKNIRWKRIGPHQKRNTTLAFPFETAKEWPKTMPEQPDGPKRPDGFARRRFKDMQRPNTTLDGATKAAKGLPKTSPKQPIGFAGRRSKETLGRKPTLDGVTKTANGWPEISGDRRGKEDDAPQQYRHEALRRARQEWPIQGYPDLQARPRTGHPPQGEKREMIEPRGCAYNAAAMSFISPVSRGLTVGA